MRAHVDNEHAADPLLRQIRAYAPGLRFGVKQSSVRLPILALVFRPVYSSLLYGAMDFLCISTSVHPSAPSLANS